MHVARKEANRDEQQKKNLKEKVPVGKEHGVNGTITLKYNFKKGWVNVNLIRLVHKYHWRALGKPVMNLAVTKKTWGISLVRKKLLALQ
jgi:hypothetical protein